MKDNMLEVGDELYYYNDEEKFYVGKIDRVTKTMAFSGGRRFRKTLLLDILGKTLYTEEPGDFTYHAKVFRLLTEDDRQDIIRQQKRRKLNKIIIDKFSCNYSVVQQLTDSQVDRIASILNEDNKEVPNAE